MKLTEKTSNTEILFLKIYHKIRWLFKKGLDAVNYAILLPFRKKEFDKKKVKKVLIINLQGIGDLIMMTSLTESLKKEFGKIDILCNENSGQIFVNDSNIKTIKYQGICKSIKIVREEYDLVICPYRAEHAGFLTAISKARYKIGYIYSINIGSNFKIQRNIKEIIPTRNPRIKSENIIKAMNIKQVVSKDESIVKIDSATKKKMLTFLKKYSGMNIIVLNCCNTWISRSWSKHKWIELGKELAIDKKNIILLMGTKQDMQFNEDIRKNIASKNVINISGEFNLHETIELLHHANIFVTTDCGPMHMGFAANTSKIISLFGSTNPELFMIPKYKKYTIWKNTDGSKCPLWNYNNEPIINNNECMDAITVKDVMKKVMMRG